jgi:hypothetical protein
MEGMVSTIFTSNEVQEKREIVRAVSDLPVNQHSQSSPDSKN